MAKRSRLQIYFDIPEVIRRGTAKPTPIMYETNSSWNTLHAVLDILIESKFIKKRKREAPKDITSLEREEEPYPITIIRSIGRLGITPMI